MGDSMARHVCAVSLVGILALTGAACQDVLPTEPTATVGEPANLDSTSPLSAEIGYCADEINRYRASVGKAMLRRSEALEGFAALVAEHDTSARLAHGYFRATNGAGIALAETEILWWRGYTVRQVIQKGLAQMWQAGPAGSHYQILAGAYSDVGCGIYVSGPEVTVVQEFR